MDKKSKAVPVRAELVSRFGSEAAADAYLVEKAKKAAQIEGMTARQYLRSIFGEGYDKREPTDALAAGPALRKRTGVVSATERQAHRWQLCLDAGLKMPTDTYGQFPRGIGKIADNLGIKRQSFTDDLNAYRERNFGR